MQGERRRVREREREREKVREQFSLLTTCINLEDVLLCLINFPTLKVCNKIKVLWMQRPDVAPILKTK
jgi:hypothetical protein